MVEVVDRGSPCFVVMLKLAAGSEESEWMLRRSGGDVGEECATTAVSKQNN